MRSKAKPAGKNWWQKKFVSREFGCASKDRVVLVTARSFLTNFDLFFTGKVGGETKGITNARFSGLENAFSFFLLSSQKKATQNRMKASEVFLVDLICLRPILTRLAIRV